MNMGKRLFSVLFLLLLFGGHLFAQDSIYFYRSGEILFSEQVDNIDSLTFLPTDYYELLRSDAIAGEIKSRPELSIFSDMLVKTGYDKRLNALTIWAPVNSALYGIDLNNMDLIRQIVRSHISNSIITTNSILNNRLKIKMLDNKYLEYLSTGTQYTLDGKKILQSNIRVAGGIIHTLDGYVPFRQNLWEYLNSNDDLDSMRIYIQSKNQKVFDQTKSFQNGVFIDSVFTITNDVLSNLANLDKEDSDYTVLIPTNQAWKVAYDSLMMLYPSTTDKDILSKQSESAKWMIIRDLFYEEKLSEQLDYGQLTSTYGSTIKNTNVVFGNSTLLTQCSNGICVSISKLGHLPIHRSEIRVEAEKDWNRSTSNSNIKIVDSPSTLEFTISEGKYTTMIPLTTSILSKVYIKYGIPNTLPGNYNVYAVFVPTLIEDTTDLRPFKISFNITFRDTSGTLINDKILTVGNNTSNPKAITKMIIAENFFIPFMDSYENTTKSPTVKIRVECASRYAESSTYNREIRTDYILFEPVE